MLHDSEKKERNSKTHPKRMIKKGKKKKIDKRNAHK